MSVWKASLLCTAYTEQQIPPLKLPELAFIGRSNVGKSSLINALVREKVAHTSSTPGKTRSINFFRVESSLSFILTDLPGFGFASRGRGEKNSWKDLVESYFAMRKGKIGVVHLVDFRHGFLEKDLIAETWLRQYEVPFQVVFTKVDKIAKGRVQALLERYLIEGPSLQNPPICVSATKKMNVELLRETLETFVLSIYQKEGTR